MDEESKVMETLKSIADSFCSEYENAHICMQAQTIGKHKVVFSITASRWYDDGEAQVFSESVSARNLDDFEAQAYDVCYELATKAKAFFAGEQVY
jgi:hypothetical protein